MKHRKFGLLCMCLAAASPAVAQSTDTHVCLANGFAFMFGPGQFRLLPRKGDWKENWCTESDSTCRFEGSKFVAYGDGFDFRYDSSTDTYSYSDMGGDYDSKGPCLHD